jgi:hypothetical protein
MAKPGRPVSATRSTSRDRRRAGGAPGRGGERRGGAGSPPAPSNPRRVGMNQLTTEARR